MKKFSHLLALLLAAMLCVVPALGALAEATDAPTEASEAPTDVMATVNGVAVIRETMDAIAQNLLYTYSQYGYDTTDEAFLKQLDQLALEYAIQFELIWQKATEWGMDQFTEEEAAALEAEATEQWTELVDTYVTYYGGLTDESTDEEKLAAQTSALAGLEAMGYTEELIRQDIRENAIYDRVQAEMVKDATVTDAEIQAAFDEKVKSDEAAYKEDIASYEYMTQYYGQTSYYVPEGYRGITHILLDVDDELLNNYQTLAASLEEQEEVEDTDEATATDVEEAPVTQADVDAAYAAILASVQPTIDEINAKLAAGTPFADLIREYGNDPGMESEPYATEGYSVHMDSIVWDPAFTKAAFSVNNVGDVAQPVVGSYGVHIVYYLRDVPAGPVALTDDIKADLQADLLTDKEYDLFDTTMATWRSEAVITYAEGVEPLEQ